jgi:GGDEF domain-containing protein
MTQLDVGRVVPRCGGWVTRARSDPVTGLVAFPDFHTAFPAHLVDAMACGAAVGVAIGDVDHLTGYGGGFDAVHPERFGHLAGNAVMARLGDLSAAWFFEQAFEAGCVSTFGGDEVIIAAEVEEPVTFELAITALRDRCRRELPRTVSFALTMVTPNVPGLRERLPDPRGAADLVLATVDLTLFTRKAARNGTADDAFIATFHLDLAEVRCVVA